MKYVCGEQIYDADSSVNQRIKGLLVDREVYACISDMAENLFSGDEDAYSSWEDWENLSVKKCSECGCMVETWENGDDEQVSCPYCGEVFEEEPEAEEQEILEYWIVSPWLGEKLKSHGEPVFERWSGWIWGRCCSGQAIFLDNVISEICCNMEILEGQSRDWSKEGVLS